MPTFRDWPRTLRPASYRGARFFVDQDEIDTGRRLVVHQFPHADTPYVEDLGRQANKIQVTAYVVYDNADSEAMSLRRACESGGAASLSLPLERLQAHCETCKRTFSKDRQGYIAFSLSFVREGSGAGPFPAAYLSQLVGWGAAALTAPLQSLVQSRFATLGLSGYVKDNAADAVRDIAAALDAGLRSVPMDADKAPAALLLAASLHDDAVDLTTVGERGDRFGARTYVAESQSLQPVLVERIDAVLLAAAEAVVADPAADLFAGLADYGADETPRTQLTASARQDVRNIAVLHQTLRILALGRYAAAVAARSYTDRRAAIQARADASEFFDAELHRLHGADCHSVYVALDDLRGRVSEHLSRQIADLAPVLIVGAELSLPSLWWANRLYGNAARASELARRNRVKHPSFMPTEFEALAR